jgi:hypothetical protein
MEHYFKKGKIMIEELYPMLCVQHGGSPACVDSNEENDFQCPTCKDIEKDLDKHLFLRATHEFDKNKNKRIFRGIQEDEEFEEKTVIGIHALDPERFMSIEEIIEENRKYYEEYECYPQINIPQDSFSRKSVIHDLLYFIEIGIVAKVRKNEG